MALFKSKPRQRHTSPSLVSRRHNKLEPLVASGFRIKAREADVMRRLVQPWQGRSFNYYDQLGEIKYASQFYSRMLAPLILFAAVKNEKGDIVETNNPDAVAALERIQDPGGGRTGLLSSYGRLMFLTGECYLFVSTDDGIEQWEMLSSDELRVEGNTYMRYKAPSLGAEEYKTAPGTDEDESAWVPIDGEATAYRLWQRHPRFSMLADSTMQGVLDLCEELVLLTKAVRARARSRLAGSGVLFIDERISPLPPEPGPDEDPQEDEFMDALVEAMTAPIADEGAASQVVPLIVRVPVPETGKVQDLVHHLQIVDPTQLYPETGLRYECIKRIAIGLDMPPEILLGMEDSNHWTAWQIGEETWKGHGQPKAQQLCDDLTASYFRPYLAVTMGEERAAEFYISYDATAIINHPDRTKDAKDLYDKRAIGKRALREAAGFDDDDAPTRPELAEHIGVATRDASLAWFGTPSVRGGNIETAPGEVVGPDDNHSSGPGGPESGAEVEPGPPPSTPQDDVLVGSSLNGHHSATVARILGAADLAVLRAREAAGARLLSLAKRDSDVRDQLKGVRTGEIAATLGRVTVKALHGPSERELVRGARELIVDTFRVWGITDGQVVTAIADTVEQHAARTLYDRVPRPLPLSFKDYVDGLLTSVK